MVDLDGAVCGSIIINFPPIFTPSSIGFLADLFYTIYEFLHSDWIPLLPWVPAHWLDSSSASSCWQSPSPVDLGPRGSCRTHPLNVALFVTCMTHSTPKSTPFSWMIYTRDYNDMPYTRSSRLEAWLWTFPGWLTLLTSSIIHISPMCSLLATPAISSAIHFSCAVVKD